MPTRLAVAGLDEAVEEARRLIAGLDRGVLMVAIGVLSFWLVVLAMCALYLCRKGSVHEECLPPCSNPC